jgi:hypothetical protein
MILLTDEVSATIKEGRYISCSHCGCRKIIKCTSTNDLRKCMDHSTWKKCGGKTRQVHSG